MPYDTLHIISIQYDTFLCYSTGLSLGLLYQDRAAHMDGAYEKSIALLEKHFQVARELKDRDLVEAARVILGMARANGRLTNYMDAVKGDLSKLLEWKSRRVPI